MRTSRGNDSLANLHHRQEVQCARKNMSEMVDFRCKRKGRDRIIND